MLRIIIHNLYLPTAALVFVFALALVAKFQPYKNKRNNTVDIILLLTVISTFIFKVAEWDNCSHICLDCSWLPIPASKEVKVPKFNGNNCNDELENCEKNG